MESGEGRLGQGTDRHGVAEREGDSRAQTQKDRGGGETQYGMRRLGRGKDWRDGVTPRPKSLVTAASGLF